MGGPGSAVLAAFAAVRVVAAALVVMTGAGLGARRGALEPGVFGHFAADRRFVGEGDRERAVFERRDLPGRFALRDGRSRVRRARSGGERAERHHTRPVGVVLVGARMALAVFVVVSRGNAGD